MTQRDDISPPAQSTCECFALDALDQVLRDYRAASGQLVALSDEGMLCVVDTWPHACLPKECHGHAWSHAEWAAFLEDFAEEGISYHVTEDGRAVVPVMHERLLWGAVVVDPGEACPKLVAEAIAPRTRSLVDSIGLRRL